MKKKAPTDKQIEAEIKKLQEMKPRVPHHTAFGDDNHEAIDAQLVVLRERLDEDAVLAKQDDGEWNEHTSSIARDAANWLNGDEKDAPSVGWPLIK